jgi:23S rRNA maturation mini-RNase III
VKNRIEFALSLMLDDSLVHQQLKAYRSQRWILLVDDELSIRDAVGQLLVQSGYQSSDRMCGWGGGITGRSVAEYSIWTYEVGMMNDVSILLFTRRHLFSNFTCFLPLLLCYIRHHTAEHQSKLLQKLRQDTTMLQLTTKEEQFMNRGRKAAAGRKNNNHRHHPIIYQDSTAFEALVGYLYLSDPDRCTQLFQWIELNVDTV